MVVCERPALDQDDDGTRMRVPASAPSGREGEVLEGDLGGVLGVGHDGSTADETLNFTPTSSVNEPLQAEYRPRRQEESPGSDPVARSGQVITSASPPRIVRHGVSTSRPSPQGPPLDDHLPAYTPSPSAAMARCGSMPRMPGLRCTDHPSTAIPAVMPAVSRGRRNNSWSVMSRWLRWAMGDHQRLMLEVIDQVWLRMRAGQVVKRRRGSWGCARARCGVSDPVRRDQTRAATTWTGSVVASGAGGDLAGAGVWSLAAGDRRVVGTIALDGQP